MMRVRERDSCRVSGKRVEAERAMAQGAPFRVTVARSAAQTTGSLGVLIALESAGAAYVVESVPEGSNHLRPAPCVVTPSGTPIANPGTAIEFILGDHHANSTDNWLCSKSESIAEWSLHVLTPALAAAAGDLLDAKLNAALTTFSSWLDQPHCFKETSPESIVIFSAMFPLISVQANRTALRSSFTLLSRWLDSVEKTPHYVAGIAAWKRIDSAGISTAAPSARPVLAPPKVDASVTISLDHHSRKILPKKGARNVLITSALPYVNNVPHLGNIIGCVLSADVFARYARVRGYNVLYVCGTDEYGTATETKAIEENLSCKDLCDKYFKFHKESYEWFDIDFDIFGRTTTPQQTTIAQDIYLKLEKNGHVFEDSMTQLYCEQHQSFLADRFVEGTCPTCGYDDARGDQCDSCGKLLNAVELIRPRCKLDNASPVIRNSNHLFLNLKDHQPTLEKWFRKASTEGFWSLNSQTITSSWLKEGLKPRCITRDLKWGTPVPRDGYDKKVFYVWFDAPIGYLSITANYTDDWEQWWKNPKDVRLYQFMGKDNVPFHTVIFPSTLIGTNEDWTLLHHLSTTEYLQYESGKFSKSRGVGVFGNNAASSGIPVEVWRYYLLSIRPESSDSHFSWSAFIASNNNELLANLGNFVNRVIKFINAQYKGVVPAYVITETPEMKLVSDINGMLTQYIDSLENVRLRQALRLVMDISARGNQYLQENRIDNKLFANARGRCDTVIATAVNLVYLISAIVYPFMPSTSAGILRQLNLPMRRVTESWTALDVLAGHQVGPAEYLFKKIEESREVELREAYSGKQKPVTDAGAGATAAKKPSSKKAAKAAAAAATSTAVPDGIQKTPEMIELEAKIVEQGACVRQLKTDKASAADITAAVSQLLEFKTQLGDLIKAASSSK